MTTATLNPEPHLSRRSPPEPETLNPLLTLLSLPHRGPGPLREWLAQITGTDPQYGLGRRFLDPLERHWSPLTTPIEQRRADHTLYRLPDDGAYQLHVPAISRRTTKSPDTYWLLLDGQFHKVTKPAVHCYLAGLPHGDTLETLQPQPYTLEDGRTATLFRF